MDPEERREYLTAEWDEIGYALDLDSAEQHAAWQRIGDDLLARWNEPHRTYHDEQHLADVLLALEQLGAAGEAIRLETLIAAWFHDAVYRGDPGEDEAESARLATTALGSLGVDDALARHVGEMIVATTPMHEIVDPPLSLVHLLDADLAIFAQPCERYDAYAAAVRVEYAHMPDADFAAGRARILSSYLEQPVIYRSETARAVWEAKARENLAREIAELGGSER